MERLSLAVKYCNEQLTKLLSVTLNQKDVRVREVNEEAFGKLIKISHSEILLAAQLELTMKNLIGTASWVI